MKIALTYTGSSAKHENYRRYILSSGQFEVLRFSAADQQLDQLDACDGLVLSGGIDIHPSFYKGASDYPNADEFNVTRDAFEIALFQRAMQKGIPILAICRGQQLVNVALGGTLIQDMGACLNKIHKVESGVDKIHGVSVVAGTLLAKVVGGAAYRGVVNSAHHQALDMVAKDLKVNCFADDGTIEGVEWADPEGKPWMMCVQWHPERMFVAGLESMPLSKAISDRFIEEVKKAKSSI
jgi:putative glutamine amidotransferase